jgi:O-methyltransferase involved in polyketide biosynthesis
MNNNKIKIDLSGVQKTLLMSLWGRAKETEKNGVKN